MEPNSALGATAGQLEALRDQLAGTNPQLYRDWALYLQVLREELPRIVDKTFFHLAVEVHPRRYGAMGERERQELHRRIAGLVQRATTLLTVEQLHALATQTERRLRRQAQRQQQRWLSAVQRQGSQALFAQPDAPGRSDFNEEAASEPPGSVQLGLALPINASLFSMASPGRDDDDNDGDPDESQLQQLLAQLLESAAVEPERTGANRDGDALLPTAPPQLLRWLDDNEAALARRLRNLSHAINVELTRLGLSTALLPLALLEAVSAGQLETLNAPLHLVRLNLPVAQLEAGLPASVLCVLLRPADLEADLLRLRTCRSRLQQARQQVRRMAQTYQRLERRLQALEAEQLWLHDHSTARPTSPPPTA